MVNNYLQWYIKLIQCMVIQAYSFNEARYKCTQHRDAPSAGKQGSGTKRSTNDG